MEYNNFNQNMKRRQITRLLKFSQNEHVMHPKCIDTFALSHLTYKHTYSHINIFTRIHCLISCRRCRPPCMQHSKMPRTTFIQLYRIMIPLSNALFIVVIFCSIWSYMQCNALHCAMLMVHSSVLVWWTDWPIGSSSGMCCKTLTVIAVMRSY